MIIMSEVLLVDDEVELLESLARALKSVGLRANIKSASTVAAARLQLKNSQPCVVVLDLCLEERRGVVSGYELIRDIVRHDYSCRVIVLTGHGGVETGVQALRCGAANFIEKPADPVHLAALIEDGFQQSQLRREYVRLQQRVADGAARFIIGESVATQKLTAAIDYAATTNQPVLFEGETGTGKGLCARALHRCSWRREGRFVRYQPLGGGPDLANSELFGHLTGAFTGAAYKRRGLLAESDGGTLFLDEVTELPLATQVGLLGALQDGYYRPIGSDQEQRVDFRLISATNQSVDRCVHEGRLRADFFHRIAHCRIELPPLRNRLEDLALLIQHILSELREREQVSVFEIHPEALSLLTAHSWPGNVRELFAVVEGAACRASFAARPEILVRDIQFSTRSEEIAFGRVSFRDQVEDFKLSLIHRALADHKGNQAQAAEQLGLDRSTLRRTLSRARQ